MNADMMAELVAQIRHEADISSRPAQRVRLTTIARKISAHHAGREQVDGLLIAGAMYMGAVKDIFALRADGKPYNERSVLHDAGALRAFDHLNAAGVALKQAIAAISPAPNKEGA